MFRLHLAFAVHIWHKGPSPTLHIIYNSVLPFELYRPLFYVDSLSQFEKIGYFFFQVRQLRCFGFPLKKRSILKGLTLLPFERKFFPFRLDPFQNFLGMQESKQEVKQVVSREKKTNKQTNKL